MSVDVTSGPSPAFYSYPSTLPSALTTAISPAQPAPAASSSSSAPSSYQSELDTLQQDDAAELMNVSLGSSANAQSNVAAVLAQAAALQNQQLAAQQQQALSDANAVPTYEGLVSASDSAAITNLGNYTSSGSSIDLLA